MVCSLLWLPHVVYSRYVFVFVAWGVFMLSVVLLLFVMRVLFWVLLCCVLFRVVGGCSFVVRVHCLLASLFFVVGVGVISVCRCL